MNNIKKNLIISIIILIFSIHYLSATQTNSTNYQYYQEKDPFIAGLLSATMLGLGQFYVKEYTKGSIFVLTDLVQDGMLIWLITNFNERYASGSDKIVRWQQLSYGDKELVLGFIVFYFGSRIYCIVDAMESAEKYNEDLKQNFSDNQNLQFNYCYKNDNMSFSLSKKF